VDINWHSFFFLLFALVTCVFAVAVVFTSNIVRMAFYLIVSLGATAGLFFLAGADFVGAMQLMMYVGGTLVLLVFGVMLTAQGPFVSLKTKGGEWILATIVGGSLLALLLQVSFSIDHWRVTDENPRTRQEHSTVSGIALALLDIRIDRIESRGGDAPPTATDARSEGRSGYLLAFEIVAVHLLVVLVGAAYLARSKKRPAKELGDSNEDNED
jgi:NADH:ubiquinone oxidoreductase subunit 6 (subunit J)